MINPIEKTTPLFPDYLEQAIQIAQSVSLPKIGAKKIVILGMGGSAIGGDILIALAEKTFPLPILVVRNEEIPLSVDSETLVIAVSYSGNTQETLQALQTAIKRNPQKIVAISTGGRLEKFALDENFPLIKIPGGLMPRAALPFTFVPLLYILQKMTDFPDMQHALHESVTVLKSIREEQISNQKIAEMLRHKLSIIYAATPTLAPAAKRWKCQINENAKQPAYYDYFPEAVHNEIVGYTAPLPIHKNMIAVILHDEDESENIKQRIEFMKSAVQKCGSETRDVTSRGKSLLGKLLSLCYQGDWVSLHLARLNGVDPTPIQIIDELKQELKALKR